MSNRRKPRLTVPFGDDDCPCCTTLGLPDLQTVPGHVVLTCCEPCIRALAFGVPHPHAMPALHWHERPTSPEDLDAVCETDSVVTQTCVVDDHRNAALMEQGQTATHDLLINGLGALRCSGVWWTHHTGQEALARVDELMPADDPDPRVAEVRAGTLEHLANEHSVFVVAWCYAATPAGQVVYS